MDPLKGNPSRRDLERLLEEIGGHVEHVRRTGEICFHHPALQETSGPANGRRKDSTRHLLQYFRKAQEAAGELPPSEVSVEDNALDAATPISRGVEPEPRLAPGVAPPLPCVYNPRLAAINAPKLPPKPKKSKLRGLVRVVKAELALFTISSPGPDSVGKLAGATAPYLSFRMTPEIGGVALALAPIACFSRALAMLHVKCGGNSVPVFGESLLLDHVAARAADTLREFETDRLACTCAWIFEDHIQGMFARLRRGKLEGTYNCPVCGGGPPIRVGKIPTSAPLDPWT